MAAHLDKERSLYDPVEDPARTSSCANCGLVPGKRFPALHLCGQCEKVHYCGRRCQKKDWPRHVEVCEAPPKEEKKGDNGDNGNGTRDMGVQADMK